MTGQASPYPGEAPPAPVYVPLDLYISEREADRHAWEAARAEDRAWMASIARDVKSLLAAHNQSVGTTQATQASSSRRWSVQLAAIAASIGAGISALVDQLRGG
jgi:hypothetical protein